MIWVGFGKRVVKPQAVLLPKQHIVIFFYFYWCYSRCGIYNINQIIYNDLKIGQSWVAT